MRKPLILILALLAASVLLCGAKHARLAVPESVGMSSAVLARCDTLLEDAVYNLRAPGAVLCVMKDGEKVLEKAYGHRTVYPRKEKMTVNTIFDLASLSKCVGTSLCVMKLVEDGKIDIDAPVDRYIEGFLPASNGVRPTVRHLLTHTSGLHSYVNVADLKARFGGANPDSLKRHISAELQRDWLPDERFIYGCPNFVTLQYIVEAVSGQKFNEFAAENIYRPLGLKDTYYLPVGTRIPDKIRRRIAPTEMQPGWEPLRGTVHDPLARELNGGVSGNAGLFSTADDLAVIAQMILNGGEYGGVRVLKPETVRLMTSVQPGKFGRTLGWDAHSSYAGLLGNDLKYDNVICHTGYTGTSMIIDFDENMVIILLTNRVHPYDEGGVGAVRAAVADAVGEAIIDRAPAGFVDLGLSVCWSQCYAGAKDTLSAGRYYAWEELIAECVHVPTMEQYEELMTKCEWTLLREGQTSYFRIVGPNGRHIIMPLVGFDGNASGATWGYCWSSDRSSFFPDEYSGICFNVSGGYRWYEGQNFMFCVKEVCQRK